MVASPSSTGSAFTVRKNPPSFDVDAPGSGISLSPLIFLWKDSPMISRERSTTTGLWHDLTSTSRVNELPAKVSVHSKDVSYE